MHDKNKDKKFYITWEISLKLILFLAVSPRAVFRTQSKVCGGAFFAKIATFSCQLFFAKKPHHKC